MIGPSGAVRVMVATTPVDFRKGTEGLAARPAQLIEGGIPTETTVAQVLVSKFTDHPLRALALGGAVPLPRRWTRRDRQQHCRALHPTARPDAQFEGTRGPENALFAGSDTGARHYAVVATLIETAKLEGVDPRAHLAGVITRVVQAHPNRDINDLMPWRYKTPEANLAAAA